MLTPYVFRALSETWKEAALFVLTLLPISVFVLLGGGLLAGSAVLVSGELARILLAIFTLFVFATVFVRYVIYLSSRLGHRTYVRDGFWKRVVRVFFLFVLGVLVTRVLSYSPFAIIVAAAVWVLFVYSSVAAGADGYTLPSSLSMGWKTLERNIANVVELLLLTLVFSVMVIPLDVSWGWLGSAVAVFITHAIFAPFLTAHVALTYLQKYPIALSYLTRL